MWRGPLTRLAIVPVAIFALALPGSGRAQEHAHSSVTAEQLAVYGKAYAAIAEARDVSQKEFAETKNKTPQAQKELRDKLVKAIAKVLQDHKLTQEQYTQITYAISTEPDLRVSFDKLMGFAPPPVTAAAAPPAMANPHVGHVTTAFNGTPGGQGLLPVALAEAKVVIDHAALAARSPNNLEGMKTHAGHILHALEPAEGSTGPGAGYGVKKAANTLAQHIDLAAKAPGASANVMTHTAHIAAAAKNTAVRADQLIALAKQVQTATAAPEAAKLVEQLNKLAPQLTAGFDANGDGRVAPQEGEAGLQLAEQHVTLMLQAEAAAAPPPAAANANPHVAHVTTAFNGTPNGQGLLATALAEGKVVVDHVALAAKNTTSLDAMKTHAGHILHAIEPAEGARGPGAGYGLKKAATNVATHIELAAKAAGATANVTTHAPHIAATAKNTIQRADQIAAIAKQIQAATSAADAARLVEQLTKLSTQLMAGVDANGDGRVTPQDGEGGLTMVEQHVNLMVGTGR